MWYWNGTDTKYKVKSWNICLFLGLFSQKLKKLIFRILHESNISVWFLIFKKWLIWVYYCWNYGPSNSKAELRADFWLQIGIYSRKNCPRHGSGHNLQQIASGQVTSLWCFNVIFEINRHLFLVSLLLTLNIVFFWLSTL